MTQTVPPREVECEQPRRIGGDPLVRVRALIIVAAGSLTTAGTIPRAKAQEPVMSEPHSWKGETWTSSGRATEERSAASVEGEQGSLVMELRRRTGLTWDQMGALFAVDRRSVHFWASGRPMKAAHREKLGRLLALIRQFPVDSESVQRWLFTPDARRRLPFDLLREGRFGEVRLPSLPPLRELQWPRVAPKVQRARTPRPPDELVGARYDNVHRDLEGARPARSVKVKPQ